MSFEIILLIICIVIIYYYYYYNIKTSNTIVQKTSNSVITTKPLPEEISEDKSLPNVVSIVNPIVSTPVKQVTTDPVTTVTTNPTSDPSSDSTETKTTNRDFLNSVSSNINAISNSVNDNVLKGKDSEKTIITAFNSVEVAATSAKALAKTAGVFSRTSKVLAPKIASRVLSLAGPRLTAILAKIGAISAKATAKLMQGLVRAGTMVAVFGAKTGAKMTAFAAMGPVGWALLAADLCFSVVSLSLDIDDTGGYGKLSTLEEYLKIKKAIDDEIHKLYVENDIKYPIVIGPYSTLKDEDVEDKIYTAAKNILNIDANPIDPLAISLQNSVRNGTYTDDKFSELVDINEVYLKASELVCKAHGGKLVDTSSGSDKNINNYQCSYPDRNTCEKSHNWPLQDEEIYSEYKDHVFGKDVGACILASPALRLLCDSNNIEYDLVEGICKIDENYCKKKGADWEYNDKINRNDCRTTVLQDIFELVLGTTVVRGLKQVFDPHQYKPCNADEVEINSFFCKKNSCAEGEDMNDPFSPLSKAINSVLVPDKTKLKGQQAKDVANIHMYMDYGTPYGPYIGLSSVGLNSTGICYPKCKPGFHSFGCCVCSPDCPQGWTDDGATCRKVGCDGNDEYIAGLCYARCKDGYDGVGPVCWQQCPAGYKNMGATCGGEVVGKQRDQPALRPCAADERDDGTSCWRDPHAMYGKRGTGVATVPKKPCPPGSYDYDGSCWTRDRGCEITGWWGPFPITKCAEIIGGYSVGERDGWKCPDDVPEEDAGLCYRRNACPSGYSPSGRDCYKNGPFGIRANLFQRQYCSDPNKKLKDGGCWSVCPSGWTDDGLTCRQSIIKKDSYTRPPKPGIRIESKPNTSYGRGVGTSMVRPKERSVEFGTKDN